jgi:hypothetical protein
LQNRSLAFVTIEFPTRCLILPRVQCRIHILIHNLLLVRYTNRFRLFATFTSMKLWVLPVLTRMVFFFMCPFSFNFCSCAIPVIAAKDILSMASSVSVLGASPSSSLSLSESLSDVLDSFSALQEYNFLLFHLCQATICLHNIDIFFPIFYLSLNDWLDLPSNELVNIC